MPPHPPENVPITPVEVSRGTSESRTPKKWLLYSGAGILIVAIGVGTAFAMPTIQTILPSLLHGPIAATSTPIGSSMTTGDGASLEATTSLPADAQLIAQNYYTNCPSFYKTNTSVYLACRPSEADGGCRPAGVRVIQGADPVTFSLFDQKTTSCFLSKDAQHVFYDSQPIVEADPSTFAALGLGLNHDSNYVYYDNERVGTLNGKTTSILTDNEYASSFYIKDGNQVYYFENQAGMDGVLDYKYELVIDADASSFKTVNGASDIDAQDKNHSYLKGKAIGGASSTIPTPAYSNTGTTTGTVIGYIWKVNSGSPKFSSIVIPAWDLGGSHFSTHEYYIYILQNNTFVFYQKAAALTKISFPEGGVSEFELLGIDPSLGLCSKDQSVTWGFTFSQTGMFNGTKEVITTNQSNPLCTTNSQTPAQSYSTDNTRDAQRIYDLQQLQSALSLYYNDYQQYPSILNSLAPNYIATIATDPSTHKPYLYAALGPTGCSTYHLGATLENSNSPFLSQAIHAAASSGICLGSGPDFAGAGNILDVTNSKLIVLP